MVPAKVKPRKFVTESTWLPRYVNLHCGSGAPTCITLKRFFYPSGNNFFECETPPSDGEAP